ncbi:glycosyltransferase family 2 protein [Chitinibacter bivalviorum]|nr:glycosyltransferase family 2 protein [Chitinibacter bivalviorum]
MITKNAQTHLAACLSSVQWADQIVIVDSGSTDDTLTIARQFTAHIHQTTDWPGFGVQKNRAIDQLSTDWVLALDADEVVSEALALEIQAAISNPQSDVYRLERRSAFCGQWVKYSGWSNDWVARLFRRGTAKYSDDLVHERLLHPSPAIAIRGTLLHYSYDDIETVLSKINSYSSAGAAQRFAQGKQAHLGTAILRGVWAFLRTYLLKLGFLDGRAGFLIAVMNAETTFYRFVKLRHLTDVSPQKPNNK